MITDLFLVMGSTGEYSDRSEWVVCAYPSEELANAHVEAAQAQANRIEAATSIYQREPDDEARVWDENMRIDYTGNHYWVQPVNLRAALPT